MSTLAAEPIPTPVPGAVNTIVVQTAQAAASQTAAVVTPTWTPSPTATATRTPTVTPSPTATFLFLLATLTRAPVIPTLGTPSEGFACVLVSQSPEDQTVYSPNKKFNTSWQVQNTGSVDWDPNNVDFVYVNGVKLATIKAADLPKLVVPGDTVTLKLSMVAPSGNGTAKTVWTLRQGKTDFCRVDLTIVVR